MTMEELSEVFSYVMIPVRIAKLFKDKGMDQAFELIRDNYCVDYDDEYSATFDALGLISDFFESDHDEEQGISTMYFSDQTLMEYYRLCREETRLKKIPFQASVYVRQAEMNVQKWLDSPDCYYCDYQLKIEPEKQWGCGIVFLFDSDYFNEFYPLIYNMLGALNFYKTILPAFRREVDALKRPFAIVPYEPKGAAA